MFRRFEVTTGNNPDRSGGFNGLAFLRCLLCCRITGFLCATAKPYRDAHLSERAQLISSEVHRSAVRNLVHVPSILPSRDPDDLRPPILRFARLRRSTALAISESRSGPEIAERDICHRPVDSLYTCWQVIVQGSLPLCGHSPLRITSHSIPFIRKENRRWLAWGPTAMG
jgi:hypothetical protein